MFWTRSPVAAATALGAVMMSTAASAAGGLVTFVDESGDRPSVEIASEDGTNPIRIHAALGPELSPNGAAVAFMRSTTPDGRRDIFLADVDGDCQHAVSSRLADERDPHWAPSAQVLAWVRERGEGEEVLIGDVSGPTQTVAQGSQPAWGGSDNDLAYVNSEGNVVAEDLESGTTVEIGAGNEPSWDPTEPRLAFSSTAGSIDIADASTADTLFSLGDGRSPEWSPDGSRIAFASGRADGNLDIYVASVGDQSVDRVTDSPFLEDNPSWSPDGSSLIFERSAADAGTNVITLSLTTEQEVEIAQGRSDADWGVGPGVNSGSCVHDRKLTLRLSGHLRAQGSVKAWDGTDLCMQYVSVSVQRREDGQWRPVGTAQTDSEGQYGVELRDRTGRYRALVAEKSKRLPSGRKHVCSGGTSELSRHRHAT